MAGAAEAMVAVAVELGFGVGGHWDLLGKLRVAIRWASVQSLFGRMLAAWGRSARLVGGNLTWPRCVPQGGRFVCFHHWGIWCLRPPNP